MFIEILIFNLSFIFIKILNIKMISDFDKLLEFIAIIVPTIAAIFTIYKQKENERLSNHYSLLRFVNLLQHVNVEEYVEEIKDKILFSKNDGKIKKNIRILFQFSDLNNQPVIKGDFEEIEFLNKESEKAQEISVGKYINKNQQYNNTLVNRNSEKTCYYFGIIIETNENEFEQIIENKFTKIIIKFSMVNALGVKYSGIHTLVLGFSEVNEMGGKYRALKVNNEYFTFDKFEFFNKN